MDLDKYRRRAASSWIFVGALFVLCGVLGVLQYSWITKVSVAARELLRSSLQASLSRLSEDFNSEVAAGVRALFPVSAQRAGAPPEFGPPSESEIAERYAHWRSGARHGQILRTIALAKREHDSLILRRLDFKKGVFETIEWPSAWTAARDRLEGMLSGERWQVKDPRALPVKEFGPVLELPLFGMPPTGAPPNLFVRRPGAWLIVEVNVEYVREVLLPELVQRHLGGDYQVEVLTNTSPPTVIYESDPGNANRIASAADASAGLLSPPFAGVFRRWPGGAPERVLGPPGPGRGPGPDAGRWRIYARHRAGSLEAVVAHARWRNLAVTACVLLLMVATLAALIRFTRRAQKLAELEMEFVAGVSHELRTPLTVIRTAAYNLRGKVAANPVQVERYGALIQHESGRLARLVEQVLRFAGAKAGRVIHETEPLSVDSLIEATVESGRDVLERARCSIEMSVEPGLPLILGDGVALKHALQNLLSNAAKYGTKESNWIGVFANKAGGGDSPAVEIRVADHGPGIPPDEQKQIFDPFFRGRRAIEDQVHGTGLGLNLVKKIVEAHGGSIRVKSEPTKGTEFIVRLPAAPNGAGA